MRQPAKKHFSLREGDKFNPLFNTDADVVLACIDEFDTVGHDLPLKVEDPSDASFQDYIGDQLSTSGVPYDTIIFIKKALKSGRYKDIIDMARRGAGVPLDWFFIAGSGTKDQLAHCYRTANLMPIGRPICAVDARGPGQPSTLADKRCTRCETRYPNLARAQHWLCSYAYFCEVLGSDEPQPLLVRKDKFEVGDYIILEVMNEPKKVALARVSQVLGETRIGSSISCRIMLDR